MQSRRIQNVEDYQAPRPARVTNVNGVGVRSAPAEEWTAVVHHRGRCRVLTPEVIPFCASPAEALERAVITIAMRPELSERWRGYDLFALPVHLSRKIEPGLTAATRKRARWG